MLHADVSPPSRRSGTEGDKGLSYRHRAASRMLLCWWRTEQTLTRDRLSIQLSQWEMNGFNPGHLLEELSNF
jgi:hypothetical protein